MSFPRYERYKDSGVEWLGEVPVHWEVMPFFSLAPERNESNRGLLEDNLLSLSYGRIVTKDINSNDGLLPESFETYQIVRPGDIVFRLTDLQNDKRSLRTAIVEETGIITSAYAAAIPSNVNPRYLNYLLRALDVQKVFYSMGGGLRQSMKYSDIKRLPTLLPCNEEQVAIVSFLDRETAKIDALVAEQERLIALLAEKRQAVISHAVTKGLNPDAPMKDSGAELLGQVPANWRLARIRYVATLNPTKAEIRDLGKETLVSFLPMEAIGDDGSLRLDMERPVGEVDTGYTFFCDGDVAFAKITPCFENFKGAIMRDLTNGIGFGTTELIVVRPRKGTMTSEYLHWLFVSTVFRKTGEGYMYGAGGQKRVPDDFVRNFVCPVPPIAEQQEITDFLDRESAMFSALTNEAIKAIDLLKERRSALISAAVTGKIDVRNA